MKWKVLPPISTDLQSLYTDSTSLLTQLLHNRSIVEPADMELFLNSDERLDHNPSLLPDMDKAVARILQALRDEESIAIFGDFDADGVTATALLVQGLEKLGGKIIPYIPHRVSEGHGLNQPALEHLQQQGISLIITADCGITANIEARKAQDLGLELIITDHHEIIETIPEAFAAIDPKRDDSPYPFRELAGVGVAYKLLQALFKKTGREDQTHEFLDLVAIGTIADLVPLVDENRFLVRRGLEVINRNRRIGLVAMMECAGQSAGQLSSDSIAFSIAPRLNAAGRLDHASVSYDLLISDTYKEAKKLAELLELRNLERQKLTSQYLTLAEEKLSPIVPETLLLFVADESFHAGVNGVVAGKLTDKYYRPSLIIEIGEKESMGSARSIPEFNIVSALTECRDLLLNFGGHAQAAGFSTPNENIPMLKRKLLDIAERELASMDIQATIVIDAEISPAWLGGETMKLIKKLEPFGKANPAPIFLSRDISVVDSRRVGREGEHLKLKLNDKGVVWDAIGFGLNHLNEASPSHIDIVYNLKQNTWGGRDQLQLEIQDFVPSV